ncbi:MAG: hypothetical protein SYC29_15935 [Planctomycetota bacterium]|nr:hypothetical protein [Planctomycetota bacterium]
MPDNHPLPGRCRTVCPVALALAVAAALTGSAMSAETAKEPAPADPSAAAVEPAYLRVVAEEDRFVALEIAAAEFTAPEETWPAVTLVGVAHIADLRYYRAIQELLRPFDIVLYESVKPAGTGGAGGDTEARRIESTRAALGFVGGLIAGFHDRHDRYPADVEELRAFAATVDPRLPDFLDAALTDAWGNPIAYAFSGGDGPASPKDGDFGAMTAPPPYRLSSLGADGKAGGEGPAADIVLKDPAGIQPPAGEPGDGLQAQLADALGLAFQLEALDYGGANWRCSDMAIDQVQREMDARGLDFSLIEDSLTGASLPAQLVRVLLGLLRFADAFLDGAVSDTIKVFLIELLGDESTLEIGFEQFGEGFTEVIIDLRNQVVVDDLEALMGADLPAESVAILYGAGHLPDLADRLRDQLGYEAGATRWLRAIEVDLTTSAVSERDVRQLRFLVRRTLRQMSRMQTPPATDED